MVILDNQKKDSISSIEPLLSSLVKELKKEEGLIGVIIHGSFANGTAHEESDVDILCITDGDWISKEIRMIDGREVEIQKIPLEKIKRDLDKRVVFIARVFKGGKILVDSNGKLEELHQKAKEIWVKGPEKATRVEVLLGKSFLRHRLEEINRLLKNPEKNPQVKLVVFQTFQAVLEAFQRLRGHWKNRTSTFLKDLPEIDPVFWGFCSEFFETEDYFVRRDLLIKMVDYALEPVGGIAEVEYETPKIPAKENYFITPIFFH